MCRESSDTPTRRRRSKGWGVRGRGLRRPYRKDYYAVLNEKDGDGRSRSPQRPEKSRMGDPTKTGPSLTTGGPNRLGSTSSWGVTQVLVVCSEKGRRRYRRVTRSPREGRGWTRGTQERGVTQGVGRRYQVTIEEESSVRKMNKTYRGGCLVFMYKGRVRGSRNLML